MTAPSHTRRTTSASLREQVATIQARDDQWRQRRNIWTGAQVREGLEAVRRDVKSNLAHRSHRATRIRHAVAAGRSIDQLAVVLYHDRGLAGAIMFPVVGDNHRTVSVVNAVLRSSLAINVQGVEMNLPAIAIVRCGNRRRGLCWPLQLFAVGGAVAIVRHTWNMRRWYSTGQSSYRRTHSGRGGQPDLRPAFCRGRWRRAGGAGEMNEGWYSASRGAVSYVLTINYYRLRLVRYPVTT